MTLPPGDPLFFLADCSFGYNGSPFLTAINLALSGGRFYGLIGPNGSGKTTLLDLLARARRPHAGTILFKNRNIADYRRQDLARLLALVPQDFTLGFDYTVFDIVLMGRHPHIPRFANPSRRDLDLVEEALSLLDIATLRNRAVTDLSGGEKQRVVVARALAQDTDVLILDEATANLDIRHSIEIMRVISERVREKAVTVIAAIHDLNLAAAFCDHLIVLENGRITGCGPVREILTDQLLQQVFAVEGHVRHPSNSLSPRIDYAFR